MVWVDVLIVAILALYGYLGYRRGFISGAAELVAFVVGLALAFLLYGALGDWITRTFHTPHGLAGLISFMLIWTVLELAMSFAWKHLLEKRIPKDAVAHPVNRVVGVVPAVLKGMVLVTILLLIVSVAPVAAAAKDPFTTSRLGRSFLAAGTAFQQRFNSLFGDALRDTLAFKTIKTGSDESVSLGFTDGNPRPCPTDEDKMLIAVNQQRNKFGLGAVRNDDPLRAVGRAHSEDMLKRGYFAHDTPEGVDPFERMDRAGVRYQIAGENLAFAPTVDIAMNGLMNSPGHRANILKPEFTRLGVGCMDAGIRGKMFSQEFAG